MSKQQKTFPLPAKGGEASGPGSGKPVVSARDVSGKIGEFPPATSDLNKVGSAPTVPPAPGERQGAATEKTDAGALLTAVVKLTEAIAALKASTDAARAPQPPIFQPVQPAQPGQIQPAQVQSVQPAQPAQPVQVQPPISQPVQPQVASPQPQAGNPPIDPAFMDSEEFVGLAASNAAVRAKVISDYLRSLAGRNSPAVMSQSDGRMPLTPVKKPTTLGEAKKMAEILIKG